MEKRYLDCYSSFRFHRDENSTTEPWHEGINESFQAYRGNTASHKARDPDSSSGGRPCCLCGERSDFESPLWTPRLFRINPRQPFLQGCLQNSMPILSTVRSVERIGQGSLSDRHPILFRLSSLKGLRTAGRGLWFSKTHGGSTKRQPLLETGFSMHSEWDPGRLYSRFWEHTQDSDSPSPKEERLLDVYALRDHIRHHKWRPNLIHIPRLIFQHDTTHAEIILFFGCYDIMKIKPATEISRKKLGKPSICIGQAVTKFVMILHTIMIKIFGRKIYTDCFTPF